MKNNFLLFLFLDIFVVTILWSSKIKGKPLPQCDITARNHSCPDGHCCVRDEFMFKDTYCRPYGKVGDNCGTRLSEFECPCEDGYQCASNIQGHLTSLFGKCSPIPGYTTETISGGTDSDKTDTDLFTSDYQTVPVVTSGIVPMQTAEGSTEMVTSKVMDTFTTDGHTKFQDSPGIVGK